LSSWSVSISRIGPSASGEVAVGYLSFLVVPLEEALVKITTEKLWDTVAGSPAGFSVFAGKVFAPAGIAGGAALNTDLSITLALPTLAVFITLSPPAHWAFRAAVLLARAGMAFFGVAGFQGELEGLLRRLY